VPPTTLKIENATTTGVQTLYHYQKYDEQHLIDLLKTRSIYCSNLGNLNDPWDSTFAFRIDDYESAAGTAEALIATAQPSRHGPEYDRMMDRRLAENPGLLRSVIDNLTQIVEAHNIESRRIYCLTLVVTSTLMWSHYSENHKGLCLEFAVKPDNVFATAFKVIYKEEFIPFELYQQDSASFLPFLVKAECWKYEEEYRLFLRVHDPSAPYPFPEHMRVEDNRIRLPEGSLASIVVGCLTPEHHAVRVRDLIAEHWPEVKLKRMFRHRYKYELEVREVD